MSGNGTIKFYVNNALVGSASFSGQIGKPEAEKSGTGSGSWGEPTVMAMGCNPKGNRADTGWRNGCFTAMNLYNLKIYNQTGCVASYEAKRNVGALKDLTGHNDGNVVAEDWTNEYIQLDGKDDWINLGSMSFRTNQVTLDLTMELVTLPSTYKTLMGNLEGGGVSLGLTEDYKPYMQINIGGSYDNAKATTALKKGQKVHLLGSYDGTTIRLFVDGQLVASKVHAGTLNPATGNTVMSIGSNPSGNSGGIEFTNMKVYTAHVYNKAYWDVSEKGDNSILAWSVNSNSSGAKKVYIASKGNIYANTDASYMFSNIGASSNCTATTALTNLNLLKTANTTNMYSMFWKTGYNAMTSLDLGTSFSTAKATNLEYMFQECGYKAMTSLNLRGINTSAATSMYAMFDGTGYTAMTSLNLGANFSTANVTKMTRMFKNCGYTKMTTLTLGSKFNTAKVTEMISMFEGTGYKVMTSLNLEGSFDTSKVTNMQAMFKNCGYTAMTTLTLGSKFNTAKVTNMQEMFANTGYTKMTKLDLGDIFYTTAATNMTSMFNATGYTAMGELDLGPAFTKIAGTYSNVFTNTGKSGCIIYAPEAIYQNKNAFKLNTSSGTTISYTRGSLNLRYKTEWIVESKNANTSAKNVTIQLRGRTNNNATSVYKSNVTSTLTKDNITVYINGAEASSISKSLGTVTTSKNPTTGYNDVLVTLTLSGFEQSALQSGKNYKEWSGDISIQIAQGTLKDSYGNKNTGLNSSGARVRESLAGPFADFIAPNVAYKFAESNIDKTNKRFTMVFDIVDKYYNASTSKTLAVTDLTIKIDGAVPDWKKVTRNLTSADLSNTVNGASKVVGKRYTLTLSNLQQSTIASGASYKDYSGVITVVVPEKKVYDTSGRYNPTTTITSGVNIPTNSGTGKVVDVVDPFWQVSNVNIDHSKNQVTMTIKGTDKYYSGNSLTKDKITVLVDGETATSVTKTLSSATSITKGVQYTLTLTTWQQSSKQSGKSYLEWSGNTVIRIAAGTLTDSNGNSSKQQDFSIGLVDFIKPTITKLSATKDAANKKETIVFDVDDKYINSTMISADNIKVYMNGVEATSITKSLSRTVKTGTVNKVSKTVGYKYTLVLTNFEQSTYQTNKEYKEWSGTVSIKIVANATKDTSNNGNVDTTITGDFVDFIKPQWRLVGSPTIDHTNNRVVMTIKGTDKYFKATTLATSNIKVYVDGTEATSVTKNLSAATDVKEGSTKVGVQYTLTLTGWEQSSKQNGKSYFEWSGNTVVKIAAGVLTDTSSNSSPETSFTIGQVDFIKPKIEKVSSSKSGGTETITFKVIDKYFNTSAKLTKDDITVLVDSETASSVSKTLSNPTEIKETVNGASKVIGHQYTMTLTNFEKTRTTIDRNREYSDWSGTVAIKVAAGKVKDTSNNTNAETTITGDFLDVIKPNVTYQFSESNIDKNGKRFTMVFDITDKYYNASTSTTLSVNDLTIKIDGAVPDWNKVTRNLTVADYSNTVYYTSNGAIKHESKVIGKRYTLTLSNLQQSSIAANASYKDYSGVVTVAIPANKVADTTGNKNNAVTITSGVNIPTNSGTGKVVDVVDPFWQVSNVNINHSTNQVTMTIKGTDKYYKASTLSRDNITVLVDGETATSVTKTLSSATSITNGVQYTLTLTTLQQSSKQSGKSYLEWSGNTVIRIAAGTMTDTNGNSSKQQDFSIGLVDFIKPVIEKVSSTKGTNNETIVFDVNDKYISTKLSAANITTLINGEVADVKTTITSISDIKGTGKHSTKTVGHRYTVVISNFNKGRKNGRKYSDWSGTVSLRIAADAVQDTSQNKNNATTITGDFVDFIKPEITYVYSSGNIDHTNKTLTVDFTVADRYFSTSTLTSNAANVTVKLIDKNINISGLTKTITKLSDYSDGSRGKVGENYRLTIGNIQRTTETDGLRDYSGPMSITFPANMVKDTSGNANDAKTITIGVNDPGTGSQQVVDVVSPVWSVASADVNTGIVKIRVKDKYLLKTGTANTALQLTTSEIAVLVNGTESTQVTKTITSGPTLVASGSNGYDTTYEYTIKIGNIAQTTTNYIEFTPKETVVGGKAKYRDENGGNITLRIKAGAVQDAFTNTNAQQDLYVGNVDNTGPEVYDIQKTIAANGDETFVFNITDKNYDSSKVVALNELNITIDGAQFSSAVQKNLTSQTLTDSATNKVLGHQYTLKLTNMKESTSSFASAVTATTNRRVYREYSGTIRIVINSNAARDLKGNTLNTATTTITSFNDKLAPEVVYIWSNSVINKNSKTFTMIFDITDKYYSSASLAIGDLTIKIGGKTPNWSSNEVGRSLSVSDIPNAAGKGKRYTLTLSNLQKLQIKSGDKYLDYSGVVTVAIPANKVKDTSGQGNVATTLTSGITIPGGTGSQEVVDVVEPYVQKMSSTVNAPAKTASITVRISDRYFNKSTLTKDTIKVYINGTENASVKTGWSTSEETESRTEKGTTSTVHVATNYTLNISGFDSNINQIKVVVPANVVKDTSENGNKQTEYIIYNVLRKQDDKGNDDAAPFFGNTTVPREDIDNVTFVSSAAGKNSTAWDVSAQGDSSILAWYTKNSNGTFKVYVGSDYEIFGNTDSSYLFRSVGLSENCTSTETITNINLLNVSSVTNMFRMFELTGNQAMTKLDLGDNFNTSNVTNMFGMFSGTGQKAMTTLNLGSNFNTSRVTEMGYMFSLTGIQKMTSLDLENNFDTSNVTNMGYMFNATGWNLMTSLNLGNKFNTSKVMYMPYMFMNCGHNVMTRLDLGSNFDTSNVTNMTSMFQGCGYTAMTSLNLGTKFDTSNVIYMRYMFSGCGYSEMTNLNLENKFDTSNVIDMESMFCATGFSKLTNLDLGSKFNTIKVTNMRQMFCATGRFALKNLNLGENFDTSNVTNMNSMFYACGADSLTSLYLGDKFYTKNVKDMYRMFTNLRQMISLDLGPAFTIIPDNYVTDEWTDVDGEKITAHYAYEKMFENNRTQNNLTIHAPESIFQDKNNFKLNTSATAGTINYTSGTINARYRTEWKKESVTVDETNKKVMITLRGRTNPEAGTTYVSKLTSSLATGNIKVYINGTEVTSINKTLDDAKYDKDNPNDVLQTLTLSNIEQGRVTGKEYKEYSGNISLEIAQGNLTDKYGNKNMAVTSAGARTGNTVADGTVQKNTSNTMFADMTKPEFTYVYADSDINHTNKTLTAIFKVADKYRASTAFTPNEDGTYDASSITVGIDSYDKTTLNNAISKKLTLEGETTEEISGQNRVTVQTYKLVIGNLEQKGQGGLSDGYTYSGILTLGFPEGTITDTSGHKSPATTITIGKNEPGGTGTGKPVDVVDPVWSVVSTNTDTGVVKLRVKDKYLTKSTSKFNLVKDSIKIIVNGVESTAIVKTLEGPTTIIDGQEYEYTLTLSNIAPSGGGYTEFTPLETIVGGTAKYRNDNGGSITIRIPAGAVTDANGNKTKQQDLNVGNMDLTEPEVYFVQKNRDLANNQETIIFNVTDKNYDSTKLIAANELTTWVDGTQMDSKLTKSISSKTISTRIDGSTRVVGHQYTLVLKGFAESDSAFASSGRVYREYSGNLQVKINKDAARDKRGNTLNSSTTTIAQITDVVRPDIKAKWSDAVINKDNKTFTMIFEMVDKYYKESASTVLSINDLTIKIDGKVPDWNKVTRSLRVENVSATVNGASKVIGKKYTLKLSNLEQLQIKEGDNYLDYSGVITVGIPANKMADETGNKNIAKTITSGVNIPGGTGAGKVVDVVDPLVEKTSSSAHAINQTATLKFKVTDKYFKASTITENNIKVLVNGTETTNGITKTLTSTALTEDRVSGETTTKVQYGVEYTLTVKGFATNANQVKIQVPAGLVTDNSGNGNKVTDMIVYNVLKPTYTGTYAKQEFKETAPFLGNASIQRQNIDNITFKDSIPADVGYDEKAQKYKNATTWDVSAQQDKSILAWYTTNANGSLKVYIGSDNEIFANQNSTDLFAYIGYSNKCTSTETITNIDLLNVTSVIDMSRMFGGTGYNAMTELDLGSKFDTSNVTGMVEMFFKCGGNAMTTLNLGENFNTSKVINMIGMFNLCGMNKLTSLDLSSGNFDTSKVTDMSCMFINMWALTNLNLGDNFDTSNVTNMKHMFESTGHNAMESLNLGNNFDTSNVTNMYRMFRGCGKEKMTSLRLENKFNTSKVTDMNEMFAYCGYKAMTSLDLGDLFYTTNVKDMYRMFYQCGATAMTSLDLGVAFTKIPNEKITKQSSDYDDWEDDKVTSYNAYDEMFTGTGKSGAVIYAPESIYKNRTSFKANSTDTITAAGTIAVSEGRTVNPIYKPEWTKVSSALKPNATAPTSLEVTVKGNAKKSQTINGVNINYNSNVTSTLSAEDIKVYINGELDGDKNKNGVIDAGETPSIGVEVSQGTPTSTNTAEVTHKITLSNFEEAARQSGKSYKEWSGNISIKIGGREEATSTYTTKSLVDSYGNQSMSATDETGTWVNVLHKDADVDKNTNGKMFTDFIKPEFTYRSITDTNIVHGTGRKVEVMFDVTDKYFESTTLSNLNASQITIGMDDYDETELNKAITKKLEKVGTITDTVNGVSNVTVGERYKLTITGLEQQNEKGLSDGYTYSGYMSLKFAKGTIKDKSGNLSDATTITIGKNEPGGSDTDKTVVDIVDPVWTLGDVDTNDGTIKLRVKDKFLIKDRSKFELTTDKITIYADDVVSTEIEKQISGPVEIRANEEYEYTLTLLNIKPDGDEYEEFTPKNPIVGGTAKYKKENGGDIMIKIAAGAVTDAYGNKTKEQIIDPGNIDGTGPEVYDIQKTKDATNNKETFVFNVTDKNYDSTDLVTIDELTVWLDGKQVDIDGEITKKFITNPVAKIDTPVEIITTVNGQERVVGHQYTLEIGSIVETNAEFVASNRKYRELSGTLEIKIATDAAKDKKGNKINPDTATITDFNDMIKPEVIYKYATSNIDKTNKIFKMEFDLVDKYCKTINNIAVTDLTIQIDGKVPDWTKVTRNLEVSDIKEPVNGTNKLIGRHYTLTLSNLEQLQVKSGDNYLDYSGVITVAIPANKMQDTTGNQNVTTTITSGVSIPAGTGSDTIVDVVDPLIEKISSTVDAPTKTATLNFKVTDKYFASSDLANGNIEILVNGAKNTTVAANNALTVVKNLTEPRTVDGKTVQVQYGIEYSLKISGFDANANQIKVRFPEKHVKDKSGNVNKQTDIMIYNVLRSAATETEVTNPFLGNTKVLRQNVDKVTFMSNIPDSVMDKTKNTFKNTNAWDVSAMQDKSIIAWYNSNEVKNGTYKVYIGSDTEIFGNTDSTNLFRNVGHSDKSTSTETITNISLLNTGSVTNMSWMFGFTGYNKMTKLELGNNFDTKNVTNMNCMFGETGCLAMTKLDLGTKFNTSKVTNMSYMFSSCGIKAMTALNLGSNFDTSKVTNMQGMFGSTGYSAMTTLNLGSKFDTSNVTSMYRMFYQTGYKVMTSLDLGSKFNTSKVTDMLCMFERTGYTAMTSLNLGANFDTSKVTNMSNMFNSTGYAKMASLDLKAKFNTSKVTNMSGMFASTGHELMTTLDLGANFDTSSVTDMSSMFEATGYKKMTTLNLREKFNTSKVTNMAKMFKNAGFTAMTSLDLGNTFYTTAATDTSEMFNNTGATAMTILDLGPAFDRIPDTNTDMFKNTGTAALVVYAPESIYSNVTTFIANRTRN